MNKFDPRYLPYVAAITTAVMLMRAAVDHFGAWGWVIGPLAGSVTSLSLATAGSRISDIAAKRKPLATAALVVMVILSPLVIYFSEETPDAGTLVWALLPDVAILLTGAITGQSLLVKQPQVAPQVVASGGQVAGKKKGKKQQAVRKSVKENELLAYLQANKGASQQQVADHFGVTRSAIGQRINKMIQDGKWKP